LHEPGGGVFDAGRIVHCGAGILPALDLREKKQAGSLHHNWVAKAGPGAGPRRNAPSTVCLRAQKKPDTADGAWRNPRRPVPGFEFDGLSTG
jgi:hypothetical protein